MDQLFGNVRNFDKWVYHYTNHYTALEKILESGMIRLSPFSSLNDPGDSKGSSFSLSSKDFDNHDPDLQEINRRANKFVKGNCQVLCMCRDREVERSVSSLHNYIRGFSLPRMWAQYSADHKGICFIFDRNILMEEIKRSCKDYGEVLFENVQYQSTHLDALNAFGLDYDEILEASLEEVMVKKKISNYQQYYFTKAADWSAENEWRCVVSNCGKNNIHIPIEKSIEGIVLGSDFPKVYDVVAKEFSNQYSAELAQVHWKNREPIILPKI
jgi:Protein of unknown function (DUF2971)